MIDAKDAEIARLRAELVEKERRIAEQGERIAELYRGQKSQILSAKSVEYAIGTLQEDIVRLREEAQHVVNEYLATNPIGSRVEYYIYRLRDALAPRPPEGKGE